MERRRTMCSCFVLFATFLFLAHPAEAQSRRRRPGQDVVEIVTDLEPVYYVSKKVAANVTCEALGADSIDFVCAGARIPRSSQTTFESYDEARRKTLVRSTIQVTRSDVMRFERAAEPGSREEYACQCTAVNRKEGAIIASRRAVIRHAFLRKEFQQTPTSQTVEQGSRAVLRCVPPLGRPTPVVIWRKDGRRLSPDKDDNLVQSADGSLTLVAVRAQDAGEYACAAKNDAGRRLSAVAILTVMEKEDEEEPSQETTPAVPELEEEEEEEDKPEFLEKPPKKIYIARGQAFPIVCDIQAKSDTTTMTLRCNGQRVKKEKLEESRDDAALRQRIAFNLTFAEVENYINRLNEEVFRCECVAWYRSPKSQRGWAFITSNGSDIHLASLKKAFEKEPRDMTVQEGNTATLVCKPPEGKPMPWVYWVFEQQRLDPRSDSRYKVEEDGSLMIQRVEERDQGRYYCVAQNQAASRNSRVATLTVSDESVTEPTEVYEPTFPDVVPRSPVFTRDLETEYYLDDTGNATLVCTVVGASQLAYRCNNDRLPLEQITQDTKVSPDRRSRLLTSSTVVSSQQIIDSGAAVFSCQCVAWYRIGNAWDSVRSTAAVINMPYLDGKMKFVSGGGSFTVGDTAEFVCQAPDGQPKPKVTWSKDGVDIYPGMDSNYLVLDDGTLIVESVRAEDVGEYTCEASNSAGTRASLPMYLEVYGVPPTTTPTPIIEDSSTTPTPTTTPYYDYRTTTPIDEMVDVMLPIFTVTPEEIVYTRGGVPVVLRCGAMRATDIVFYCDGVRMAAQDDADMQSVDPSVVVKTVEVPPSAMESGASPRCECQALYQAVDGSTQSLVAETLIKESYLKRRFRQNPESDQAEEGSRVELLCTPPEGDPEPTVSWLKDGIHMDVSGNTRVTEAGSLVFEQIQSSDEGDYTCVAQNVHATRYSWPAALQVIPASTPTPPYPGVDGDDDEDETTMMTTTVGDMLGGDFPIFTLMPDQMVYILRNQPAVLRCGAMQVTDLRFYCNGDRVLAQEDDDMLSVDPTPGLTFLEKSIEVRRSDLENFAGPGPYTCQCRAFFETDDGTEDYLSTDTVLKHAYLKGRFEENPESQTAEEGSRVELVCRPPMGDPEPEVHWVKNGMRMDVSGNTRVTSAGSLVFEQIASSDEGNYTCAAKNIMTTRYSDTVSVQVTPKMAATPAVGMGEGETTPTTTSEPEPESTDGIMIIPEGEGEEEEEVDEEEEEEAGESEGLPEEEEEEEEDVDGKEPVYPETTPESEGEGEDRVGEWEEGVVEGSQPEEEAGMKTGNEVDVVVGGAGAGAGGGQDGSVGGMDGMEEPMFLAQPEPLYYIVKSRPVTIFCKTKGADRITFKCNEFNIPQSMVHYQNMVEGEENVLMASIDVSREAVENYNDQHNDQGFYCQCHAQVTLPGQSMPSFLPSSQGFVEVAYLRKFFVEEPENKTVPEGEFISLQCKAPEGNPTPEIKWMKDGEEVFGDVSPPDRSLIFDKIRADQAGTYYCVASNVANTRQSSPAIVVVAGVGSEKEMDTGAPIVDEGAQHQGGAADDRIKCLEVLKDCSAYMPQTQRDQASSCQTLPRYVMCIDKFLEQCSQFMNEESLKSAEMSRDTAKRVCSGKGMCPELQTCQAEYSMLSMPDPSMDFMPMTQLCAGIDTFLRCADGAMMTCNMTSDDHPATKLSDVATWFQQYCERVSEGRWVEQCDSLMKCEVPTQQSAVLNNMVQVPLWCQQIREMLNCSNHVLPACDLQVEPDDDLEFLADLASVTCPVMPESDGEDEGDDMGEDSELGKSMDEGGAENARASVLLTSLLSLMMAMAVLR
ncbi:uncharacterized protein LOC143286732 isoform X2 [Babylonia areolata]|uniref:uncharacterized protein LOC143286732 isoform X2 n=1 Tax=Babylonia areolata TaxID=304850 RepID=UPI003FD36201